MVFIYFFFTTYQTSEIWSYSSFQDIHVMMFIGFGYLMTFLKKYCFSSIGFNFLIAAFIIEWSMLTIGFWDRADGVEEWDSKIHLSVKSLINADFSAASFLISFGAVLGKLNIFQLTIMAFIQVIFYSLNMMILGCGHGICIGDIGGSIIIHTFGAYFGLTVSYMLGGDKAITSADCSSNKISDLFSMIGTIFLWMFWPSFNSAPAGTASETGRAIFNTLLSISASCVASFIVSSKLSGDNKFHMVHVQNASIAGGVGIGAVANLIIKPGGAVAIGLAAGTLSTFGFCKITPFLEENFRLHDTCGVHNLHGMPGVLSAIASFLVAFSVTENKYGTTYLSAYPNLDKHSPNYQAGLQLAGLAITLGIAVVTGCFTGFLIRQPFFEPPNAIFDDETFWDYEHGFEHGHVVISDQSKKEMLQPQIDLTVIKK
jgi:ammonium transporter Rh